MNSLDDLETRKTEDKRTAVRRFRAGLNHNIKFARNNFASQAGRINSPSQVSKCMRMIVFPDLRMMEA